MGQAETKRGHNEGERGGIVRARGVANKQLLSLHVMRQKENSQRLKEKQTLKAKKQKKNEKEKRKEFSTEMGFTSLCILNLKNADKLVCAGEAGDMAGRDFSSTSNMQ